MTSTRKRGSRFLLDANFLDGVDYAGRLVARTGQVLSFSRGGTAGTASSVDVNGRVFIPGSSTPRFYHQYDTTSGTWLPKGVLFEGARTNDLTKSRDLTDAAWTKTNVTAAAATGADGVASSGSRLTATGANGTCIRAAALVHASQARAGSMVAKRVTGSGNVQLTLDNGATWTTVTLTTAFAQLATTQTLANSQFGIRLVTSGDVIDVDFTGNEAGAFQSRPIPTTASALTRSADSGSFAWNVAPGAMTVYCKGVYLGSSNGMGLFYIGDGPGAGPWFYVSNSGGAGYRVIHSNGVSTPNATLAAFPSIGDTFEVRAVLNADGSVLIGQSVNGAAETTASTASTATPFASAWGAPTLYINSIGSGSQGFAAHQSLRLAPGVQTLSYMRAG